MCSIYFDELVECLKNEKKSNKCCEDILGESCEELDKSGALEASHYHRYNEGPDTNPGSPWQESRVAQICIAKLKQCLKIKIFLRFDRFYFPFIFHIEYDVCH